MGTVIAIDQGFRWTGYVVASPVGMRPDVVAVGLLRTAPSKRKVTVASDDLACIRNLARELVDVIDRYNPGALVCEAFSGSRHAKAAKSMAYAYAIVGALAEARRLPLVLVTAGAAKKRATGVRNASKAAVVQATLASLPADMLEAVTPPSGREHVHDAMALLLAAWDGDVVRAVTQRTSGWDDAHQPRKGLSDRMGAAGVTS